MTASFALLTSDYHLSDIPVQSNQFFVNGFDRLVLSRTNALLDFNEKVAVTACTQLAHPTASLWVGLLLSGIYPSPQQPTN